MTQLSAHPWKLSNLFALLLLTATMLQARRISSRRLIIHVPVKLKTHHHTHTVYKVLHGGNSGGGVKQTIYKLVGFSGEGGPSGMGHGSYGQSYGHGHSHSHNHGLGGLGEITYEDRHGCESGKVMPMSSGHRDMVFNHYARHDQEEEEELAETAGASGYAEERDEFIDVRDAWL